MPNNNTIRLAWLVTLAVTSLPDIILQESTGVLPNWILPAKAGLLIAALGFSLGERHFRALRHYFLILLLLLLVSWAQLQVSATDWWAAQLGAAPSSSSALLGGQLLRLVGTFIIIGGLLLLRYTPQAFFLQRGRLDATARRVRWLGMRGPEPWTRFGRNFAIIITAVTLVFLLAAAPVDQWENWNILPVLPVVLLLASLNAFNEEVSYRGALLAPLIGAVGQRHAVLLTAVLFGLAHFYGVPYGLIGVVLATFLGWILGKSMIETQGMFWA